MRRLWGFWGVASLAFFSVAPSAAYARDWWVLEPDGTCRTPHVFSSPADEVKTLMREGHSVDVKKTDFPDGSFALIVTAPAGKNIWVTSEQTCTFLLAVRAPAQIDNDWDDFQ